MLRIQVLGLTRAWVGGEPADLGPAGQRALLGLLILAGGQPVSRAALVHGLWDDEPPESAVNVLQTRVKHLRRVLEPGRTARTASELIPLAGDGYRFAAPPGSVDLAEFRRLVRQAGQEHDDRRLDAALRLWPHGEPFADVPLLGRHPAVIALGEERRAVLTRYATVMLADGHTGRAVRLLAEAAAARPLDEAGQARLIRALRVVGRRAEAFETFHAVRATLAEELGVDPGPELTAAHEELLAEDRGGLPSSSPNGPGVAVSPPLPEARTAPPPAGRPGDVAGSRTAPPPAELPGEVAGFTGRQAESAELDRLAGSGQRIVVVSGTAGVGKTSLAVRWGHRARDRFPDGQLYVDLRGYHPEQPVTAGDALAGLLRSLGLTADQIPPGLAERSARLRSLLAGRRMLLLLDNAATVDQVRPLLPGAGACVTLVTSRDSLAGLVAGQGADRLELDLLPLADAVALVGRLLRSRAGDEATAVAALAVRCARLPLALRIAAELALMRGTPLSDLVGELSDRHRSLDVLATGDDPQTDVAVVLSWSYGHLPPHAARVFRLLGVHPGPDIDGHALTALCGDARPAVDVLTRAHLIRRTDTDRYVLHDLLQAYAARLAAADDESEQALDRLLRYYRLAAQTAAETMYPAERRRLVDSPAPAGPGPLLDTAARSLAWLDTERANLVATAVHAERHGRPEHTTALTLVLLRYVEAGGHHDEAATLHTHALRAAARLGDPRQEAHLETNFAVILAQQGRYPEAELRLRRAAATTTDPAARARALGNLGHLHERQGRYAEAAGLLAEAIVLCRTAGDATGEARALGNLGQVLLRQDRPGEAADRLSAAVVINRRIGDAVGEAYALISLAHIALRDGAHDRAAALSGTALTLCRGNNEPGGEGYALNALGLARLGAGDHDTAVDLLRQALVTFSRLGERAGEADAGNSLGEALAAAGLPSQARAHHESALALAVEIGDHHQRERAVRGLSSTVPPESSR
ncbi:AfsR/SARP family transcriptional regulator [Actinoplanes subglobosus]|uniref:BTAD domain-containing putative transcriptional regulator n=1 Tax=Actinoplanes subglobosus TaxID=1547892 RepID=A0ABV8J615_9ACTN